MWGMRMVIPASLCQRYLNELHEHHLGVVKMKSLARNLLWSPGLNADIKRMVKACATFRAGADNPSRVSFLWPPTDRMWQRIHEHFAGPVMCRMFLVVIDAYLKWPEVAIMQSISVENTVKRLWNIFFKHRCSRDFSFGQCSTVCI